MPLYLATLVSCSRIQWRAFVKCLSGEGADDADLVIFDALLATRIDHWMDVQTRGVGFTGKLP